MTNESECRQKAQKYEQQAKLVSDPWVKERLYILARYWREIAEESEDSSRKCGARAA
jgi:hypothetical protein